MNTPQKFEMAVLGSGPGGYVAAARAAQLGMKTAVIERDSLGGVCLNWGCIPTKALLESAHAWKLLKNSPQYGLAFAEPSFEFEKIIANSRSVADRMSKGIGFLMKNRNVSVIKGVGTVNLNEDGHPYLDVVQSSELTRVEADHLIIATGGRPAEFPGTAFDGQEIIHSTHAMTMKQCPKSMVIIGAGAIGMEFASFYRALGTEITIIEMMQQILPYEDEEIVIELSRSLRRQKMTVLTGTKVTAVQRETGLGVKVQAENARREIQIHAEKLLVATGIRPNTENLGLEKAGVELERGFVKTDSFGKTSVKGLYAVGDVTGPPLLAHKASAEALVCVDAIAGLQPSPVNFNHIPGCTYCMPQVASVGVTEKKAREKGLDIKTGSFPFRANGRSITMNETEGMVKLVFDAANDYALVGAHIIHAMAGELIAEPSIVLSRGGNAHDIARTVHAHPTLAEAIMEAAEDALGRPVHK